MISFVVDGLVLGPNIYSNNLEGKIKNKIYRKNIVSVLISYIFA